MAFAHQRRYDGTRWAVRYGANEGPQKVALHELQGMFQECVPYVVDVREAAGRPAAEHEEHLALIGTLDNHPMLGDLAARGAISVPAQANGYTTACLDSPWSEGRKLLVVAGHDAIGVLHGTVALNAQTLVHHASARTLQRAERRLDALASFSCVETPRLANRGIWTWGYVIYDYRRFLDNMARLRMNMLVVWNDEPPLNSEEVIAYAHERGIQVVFGFHWGWGIADLDPSSDAQREQIKREVVTNYREQYRHLGLDGIYFQTFTEQTETEVAGRSIASWACLWVNDIARALLEDEPDLKIYFGLHAQSIVDNYPDFKALDPHVVIMWEDAGSIPYGYDPVPDFCWGLPDDPDAVRVNRPRTPEGTLAYSKKLATFRGRGEFAMVPKGWSCLSWPNEFEHHGSFVLGERTRDYIRARLWEKQRHWDEINRRWLRHYPHALRFYRDMLTCENETMTACGLVEDGLFEEKIQPSVALFGEMLWNPQRDDAEVLDAALSPYYARA